MQSSSERIDLQTGDALLVVDVQRDFLPGGALAVPEGDAVLRPLHDGIGRFVAQGLPVLASRDWHPPDHCSFQAAGGPWPPHCVAGSAGADFAHELALPGEAHVVSKGEQREREAYSAFAGTPLDQLLCTAGVRRLFVGGLATDYCVQASVLDALGLGYAVVVLVDAVAAVDVRPGDGEAAIGRMRDAGAKLGRSDALR
jgi:nicotinamidase/pyrazinamidase